MPFSDIDTFLHDIMCYLSYILWLIGALILLLLLYYRMYYSSGAENHFSNDAEANDSSTDDDENLDRSDQENTVETCSCSPGEEEVVSDDGIYADDLFTVYV